MPLPRLDAEALAPLVTVLRARDGKPGEVPEVMATGDVPGRHAFTILCPQPANPASAAVTKLERHPHSTQTFVPIVVGRWVVVAMPTLPDGSPDVERAQAFMAGPEDAVCIARNVWHAPLMVFDRPAQMGMIMWKAEAGDDGVLYDLPQPIRLEV